MTNKVKFKLKITGFELEIEGTKENAAMITGQVSDTLRGLMNPSILNGDEQNNGNSNGNANNHTEDAEATVIQPTLNPAKNRSKRARTQTPKPTVQPVAIEFKHDVAKFGMPSIKWSTAIKSLWLLYVLKEIQNIESLTANQIITTFNKHFKQSKTIQNVTRDLGKLKVDSNYYVSEDTTKTPSEWYITETGINTFRN